MKYIPVMFMVAALAALLPQRFPGGNQGMGFDDLGFAATLRKVMVPGGSTSELALIDPDFRKIEIISGFSERAGYSGGHGDGITSSDAGRGLIYVTERSSRLLDIVDPNAQKIIAHTRLASGPDYMRFVSETKEVWVREPRAQRIEIFSLTDSGTSAATLSAFIPVPGGPEWLVIGREQAFTHLWMALIVQPPMIATSYTSAIPCTAKFWYSTARSLPASEQWFL